MSLLRFVLLQLLIFLHESLILCVKLMQLGDVRLLSHTSLSFDQLVLLEVTQVFKRLYNLYETSTTYL